MANKHKLLFRLIALRGQNHAPSIRNQTNEKQTSHQTPFFSTLASEFLLSGEIEIVISIENPTLASRVCHIDGGRAIAF